MYYALLVSSVEPPPPRRRRRTLAMFIVALLGLPLGAGAVGRAIDFLPAVQSATENARINIANLKDLSGGLPPDPCKVSVAFYDATGKIAAGHAQAFTLAPGASVSVASPYVNAFGGNVLQRGRITFAAAPKSGLDTCGGVAASFEVFDTATQQTRFMNPGVIRGFNPQPDPPVLGVEAADE